MAASWLPITEALQESLLQAGPTSSPVLAPVCPPCVLGLRESHPALTLHEWAALAAEDRWSQTREEQAGLKVPSDHTQVSRPWHCDSMFLSHVSTEEWPQPLLRETQVTSLSLLFSELSCSGSKTEKKRPLCVSLSKLCFISSNLRTSNRRPKQATQAPSAQTGFALLWCPKKADNRVSCPAQLLRHFAACFHSRHRMFSS